MKYVVILTSSNKELLEEDKDRLVSEIHIDATDEEMAVRRSIDWFYKTKWTNTEHNKDKFDDAVNDFNGRLDKLFENNPYNLRFDFINLMKSKFEDELRERFPCVDISITTFSVFSIRNKIKYLNQIGCILDYVVYPKKVEYEVVKLK